MTNWIDTLGDTIFHVAQSFMDSKRPKRLIGIASIAITAFALLGTSIVVARGGNLGFVGFAVLIPALVATASIALYCFATDRGQQGS